MNAFLEINENLAITKEEDGIVLRVTPDPRNPIVHAHFDISDEDAHRLCMWLMEK